MIVFSELRSITWVNVLTPSSPLQWHENWPWRFSSEREREIILREGSYSFQCHTTLAFTPSNIFQVRKIHFQLGISFKTNLKNKYCSTRTAIFRSLKTIYYCRWRFRAFVVMYKKMQHSYFNKTTDTLYIFSKSFKDFKQEYKS